MPASDRALEPPGADALDCSSDPTLVELAGLPAVPKCKGDPAANVHCLHGTSYASAFGVGTAQPRAAALHQWPYSVYKADSPTADPWRGPSNPNCAQGLNGTVLPATECPHTMACASPVPCLVAAG